MEATLHRLLNDIQTIQQEYNEQISIPATALDLQRLEFEAAQKLVYNLPKAYLDLLSHTDGIEWNGHQLYASKAQPFINEAGRLKYTMRGLVEVNEHWRIFGPNQQYIFFAESGEQLYCHNLESGKYEIVDRITKELDDPETDSFATCTELLEKLLNHILNRYEA